MRGHLHPISSLIREANQIFIQMGFTLEEGPQLETQWHNFDALNIPKDHPARDMQDTFWLKRDANMRMHANGANKLVLRTHTSPVQIRYMEEKLKAGIQPPYRIIVPGKVFRNEATDATHEAQFFQVEGLFVDKKVSLAELKGVLSRFFKKYFGSDAEIRFRPSFFSFTEPSVEVDMRLRSLSNGMRRGKWLEMAGAGLVHPNVFKAVGLSGCAGFAFGIGIDRLIMVKYGIEDIRLFYNGDLRLVSQF